MDSSNINNLKPIASADSVQLHGLESIILHHSIFKGRRVNLSCDGHTNNTGTNGAGKTSVLHLIPTFYGGEPDRLINRSADKVSFVDYYLPNNQSMIVFEYRRITGLACAVMYRRSLGAFAYRFITGAAKDTLFNDDNISLIEGGIDAKELLSHLHLSSDIQVSRQIENIIDYRSIIENNLLDLHRNKRDKGNFKQEAYDYCLGSPDSHMQHISLLTSVTLDKRNILSNFKSMIIDAFLRNGIVTNLPRHSKDNELLSDIAGLQAFEIKSDQLRLCVEQWNELKANWQDIHSHQDLLSSLIKEKEAELDRVRKKIDVTGKSLKEVTDSYQEKINGEQREKSRLAIEQETSSANIDRLHDEQSDWHDKDVSGKKSLIEDLPNKTLALVNERTHLEKLEDQTTSISDKFNGLIDQSRLASAGEIAQLNQGLSALRESHLKNKSKHEQKLVQLELATSKEMNEIRKLHDAAVESKSKIRDKLIKGSVSSVLTDEEKQVIDLAKQGVTKSLQSVENEQELLDAAEESLVLHTGCRDDGLKELTQLKQDLDHAQSQTDTIKSKLYPNDNSLLSDLRTNKSDWGDTIGRVINPDILQLTNLLPSSIGNSTESSASSKAESFYGLSLDLTGIQPCEEALSEQELRQRHRQAEEKLRACLDLHSSSKEAQVNLEGTVKTSLKGSELIRGRLVNRKKGLKSAESAERFANEEVESAIKKRQSSFKQELEAFDQKSNDVKAAMEEQVNSTQTSLKARLLESESNMSFLIEEFESSENKIEERIEKAESNLSVKIKEFEQQLNDEREKRGVDSTATSAAETRIKTLVSDIENINDYKEEVSEYELWLKQQWSQCDKYTQRDFDLLEEIKQLDTTIKRLEHDLDEQVIKLNGELDSLTNKKDGEADDIDKGGILLKKCTERLAIGSYVDQSTFQTNFNAAFEHLHTLLVDENTLRLDVLRNMRIVQQIISDHGRSQVSRAWVELINKRVNESKFDRSDDEFKLECADDLQRLNLDIIPQVKGTLIESARSVGDSINRYYDNLSYLNRQISTVSNKLEKSINADHSFDVISDIKVGLHSKIKDDNTWSPLHEFNEEWIKWSGSNFKEIPGDEFIRRLKEARDSLDSVKIKPSVNSLIDIEISLIENGDRRVVIRNDNDLIHASSEGISYIATLIVFVGLTRYLCPDNNIAINWPIDELGKIHASNISKLFEMMDHHGIRLFSAQPNASASLLKKFNKQYILDKHDGVAQMVKQSMGMNPFKHEKS